MTIVYRPEPEPIVSRHGCAYLTMWADLPPGSIDRCECGEFWQVDNRNHWTSIRPWSFKAKRRIREWEDAQRETAKRETELAALAVGIGSRIDN